MADVFGVTSGDVAAGRVAARAAPIATSFFGWVSIAIGQRNSLASSSATSGIRDDPPTSTIAVSRAGLGVGGAQRPPRRTDGLLDGGPDDVLELTPGQPHRGAGLRQDDRDDRFDIGGQCLLRLDAVPPQPAPARPSEPLRPLPCRRSLRIEGIAAATGRSPGGTPPRRSRCRRGVRCPPAGRGSGIRPSVFSSTHTSKVPPPRSYTAIRSPIATLVRDAYCRAAASGSEQARASVDIGECGHLPEQVDLEVGPVRRIGQGDVHAAARPSARSPCRPPTAAPGPSSPAPSTADPRPGSAPGRRSGA